MCIFVIYVSLSSMYHCHLCVIVIYVSLLSMCHCHLCVIVIYVSLSSTCHCHLCKDILACVKAKAVTQISNYLDSIRDSVGCDKLSVGMSES